MHRCGYWLLAAGMLALAGCAGSPYSQGQQLLAREDYAGAARALRAALAAEPDNAALMVDLAEALYQLDELEPAKSYLKQARALDPDNSEAVLVLGLIHEKNGDLGAAINVYRSYARMSRLDRTRKIVKARLDRLIREQIQEEIREALEQEALLDVASVPDHAIAVAPFRNLGANESLDPLQKGLAEMMITDLSKVRTLQVVERLRMQEMMKEIGLGMTGAVDPATAPRLGKLLGAGRVVSGSFADLAEEQLRLDISVAGVKTGDLDASQTQGPLARLFRLQKELTFGLIEEMGIALSDEERDAIQKIPTENLLAFMSYCRGLDLEDQGKSTEAAAAFEKAARLDPKFRAAHERMERAEGAALGAASRRAVEQEMLKKRRFRREGMKPGKPPRRPLAGQFGPPSGVAPGKRTLDRLRKSGMNAGAGFLPAWQKAPKEVRKPIHEHLEELEKINFGPDAAVEIVVPLE